MLVIRLLKSLMFETTINYSKIFNVSSLDHIQQPRIRVSSRINTLNNFRRLQEFHDTTTKIRPRLGGASTNNLGFLRQRVERQRSIANSQSARCDSLEDINSELKNDVENTKNSVERLDNQISSLHQDVATLSMEVCEHKR